MKAWTAVVLLVALAAPAAACRKHEQEEVETTGVVPVSVESVRKGTIQAVVTAAAVVKPANGAEIDVVPPAEARIAELPAAIGDRVSKGGLLARFEIPTLAAELGAREADARSARATLENAEAAYDRESHLVERGIAAEKELQAARQERTTAEAAVASSQSALAAAQKLAARAVVRAPFDGVVVARTHNPGDLVDAGAEPILRFVDPTHLQVEAEVPVADLPRLKAGASARVTAPAFVPETATVLAIPGAVDPETAIATVRLGLPSTTKLPSGTPVRVEIVEAAKADALIVPAAAIVREGDETFVFVAGDDNVAHRRKVTVGIVAEPDAEIVSGVNVDERVVSRGAAGLPDGAKIALRG